MLLSDDMCNVRPDRLARIRWVEALITRKLANWHTSSSTGSAVSPNGKGY